MSIPNVLAIAGSDPSGGAGVQADLKTIAALGGYGMAALTALTAQNTQGVHAVRRVPAPFVMRQVDAVLADIRVDAVKTGMLGSAATVRALAALLARAAVPVRVVDPVLIAKGGARLTSDRTLAAVRSALLAQATVITPNLPEAAALLGSAEPESVPAMHAAARALRALGSQAVLLKGGHLPGDTCVDVLCDADGTTEFAAARIPTTHTHGTGCTLASALATLLARGLDLPAAVAAAKDYVTAAIRAGEALEVGSGHGPLDHAFALRAPAP
jgi:hydroxymethylpyrimidine/phosphomethylpyrimidine kinase